MKKVMIIANHAGGLYKFRKELLEELLKENYEVYAVLPTDNANAENIEKIGVKTINVNIDRRGINPIRDLKLIFQYFKITGKVKPDIILTYTIKPNIYAGMVARIRKIPTICNITGIGSAFQKDGLLRKILVFLYRIALKKSKCVFFQNSSNKELFENFKIINSKVKLVPGSGVNLNDNSYEDYPKESEKTIIIFAGRLMREKGINEFLEMAKDIKPKNKNVEFKIYGEYEEEQYKSILEEYTQKNIVTYCGHKNKMHEFYKEANCLILPSYHEGTSNVLLEASATGRPVIASNIPGCKEIIDNEKTGYVFEVKNSKDLAEKVQKFVDLLYSEKVQMGKMAREKVEKEFDRKIVINSYLEEINEILK